jgi:hypothetical protein
MLNAQRIIAEAEKQVGVSDSETHIHANLAALVEALNGDAALSASGEASAHRNLLSRTVDRLSGVKWLLGHPEIAREQIAVPVFLTGLPRSGTTYFQYLFDVDRRFRLIRTWEAMMPSPPPGYDAQSVIDRKARESERRRQLLPREIEGFDALHLIDAGGSDECHAFMEQSYAAAGFFNLYDVPSYFDYLMRDLDLVEAYRVHRRQLQLLQWRAPQPRWALKYPNHVIAMDAILEVYPDARFAMTHRDPVQTLASIAKMSLTLRTVRYDEPVDPYRIGRQMLDFVRRHIDRIMAFTAGPNADRVTHVDYYALAADPATKIEEVHEDLGIDTPEDVRESMADWRRRNPKNARGANDYALEQFGIRAEEARELYGDYTRRFDIPREAEGLSRARTMA